MLAIRNSSRHAATAVVMTDHDGADVLVVVAKATYRIARGEAPLLAEEPLPLAYADAYRDEPGTSGLVATSDFALFKPVTDVVVLGTARAPGGKRVAEMTVEVEVGPVKAAVRVVGDRVWKKNGLFGFKPGPAKPFTEMPLDWERAFGGTRLTKDGKVEARFEANPLGRGFLTDPKKADDEALPNLEDPGAQVRAPKDQPAAHGVGFVCPDWEPRRALAGTYDAAWEEKRLPLLPEDFDYRFFNTAPPALQAAGFLQGGERVRLAGFDDRGEWKFTLPTDRLKARLLYPADVVEEHPLALDTVILEPDEQRLQMVWRAKLATPVPLTRLLHVDIVSERHPAPPTEEEAAVAATPGANGG